MCEGLVVKNSKRGADFIVLLPLNFFLFMIF